MFIQPPSPSPNTSPHYTTLHSQQDAAAALGACLAWNVRLNTSYNLVAVATEQPTAEGPVDFCGGALPICGPPVVSKTNTGPF